MKFIYPGEVDISPDKINTFLAVAQDLPVKGLKEVRPGLRSPPTTTSPLLLVEERSIKTGKPSPSTRQYTDKYVESEDYDVKPNLQISFKYI